MIIEGAYFQASERVAQTAFELCQWLDKYEVDYGSSYTALPLGLRRRHLSLHEDLEPWEKIKFGEGN